jgi:hypothetical protein
LNCGNYVFQRAGHPVAVVERPDSNTRLATGRPQQRDRVRRRPPLGTIAVFQRGTRIGTLDGEVPIEALTPGNYLVAYPQHSLSVTSIDASPTPVRSRLVRILQDAFGAGLPHRDLLLHVDQSVYWDNILIPIRLLVPNKNVRHEPVLGVRSIGIRLREPSLLISEGIWVSTWQNTDQRGYYFVGGQAILNAGYSAEESETMTGPILARVNEFLTKRSLGICTAALWLTRGEKIIEAIPDRSKFVFAVSAGSIDLTIISGNAVVGDAAEFPRDASRRAGIAIARVQVRSGDEVRDLPMDHPDWTMGFCECQWSGMQPFRWTTGTARIPPILLKGLAGPLQLTITLLNQ